MIRKIALISLVIAVLSVVLAARPQDFAARPSTDDLAITTVAAPVAWEANEATEPFRSGLTSSSLFASNTVAEFGANEVSSTMSNTPGTSPDFDVASLSFDEAPSAEHSKVPEPATLVLLGSGLIGTARVSRIKRGPERLGRLIWARVGSALLH